MRVNMLRLSHDGITREALPRPASDREPICRPSARSNRAKKNWSDSEAMTLKRHQQLATWGFLLTYLSGMAAILLWSSHFGTFLTVCILLQVFVVGASLIAIANVAQVEYD